MNYPGEILHYSHFKYAQFGHTLRLYNDVWLLGTCLSVMSGESGLKSGVIAGVAPGVIAVFSGRTIDDIDAVDSLDDTDIALLRKARLGISNSSSSS